MSGEATFTDLDDEHRNLLESLVELSTTAAHMLMNPEMAIFPVRHGTNLLAWMQREIHPRMKDVLRPVCPICGTQFPELSVQHQAHLPLPAQFGELSPP